MRVLPTMVLLLLLLMVKKKKMMMLLCWFWAVVDAGRGWRGEAANAAVCVFAGADIAGCDCCWAAIVATIVAANVAMDVGGCLEQLRLDQLGRVVRHAGAGAGIGRRRSMCCSGACFVWCAGIERVRRACGAASPVPAACSSSARASRPVV